jgi:pyruvate dehydrogenase E2 component (dihydrolipoamide acetyltransferase)
MAGVKQPLDKSYFILPDLGEGVAEAELIEWKVAPGQKVAEHQTLAEMETDKARVEVPSPWSGVVKELNGAPGDIIKVGATLVTYDIGSGPAAAAAQSKTTKSVASAPQRSFESKPPAGDREDAGTVVGSVGSEMKISERFARRREEQNGPAGAHGKSLATPAVRRIARDLGVDVDRIEGTGRGGRVTAADVENHATDIGGAGRERGAGARERGVELPTTRVRERDDLGAERITRPVLEEDFGGDAGDVAGRRPAPPVSGDGVSQRIPFRGVRRKIAQALRHSVSTTVHFTVVDEADVTDLDRKRRELIFATGEKISLLPFIMLAAIKALREHPTMNANVDDEKEEILLKSVINLGVAVDTEHGLMVPVLASADRSSVFELHRRVKDVAARCKNRTIPREELIGGTFTISNVGSYGGMFATPIINYPEVGILAAGRAKERVLPKGGGFHLGTILPLSLSCDHRVVDGAEGARFLNTVVRLLENPERLLRP